MKKLFNYSLLIFLFSFIAFSCSKEEGEMGPSASLTNNFAVGDFGVSCLTQSGSQASFSIAAGSRFGLSNLQLELLECPEPGTTVELGEDAVEIVNANIKINGIDYPLIPLYNSDGSCVTIKEDDFTSFVKFEFDGGLDDLVKKHGGVVSFSLSDGNILLWGANVIIKTGGRDDKCYRNFIENCKGCTPPPPVGNCSYSQGRFFNPGNGGKHWPAEVNFVKVGDKTIYNGEMTLPGTNAADRAFFQAATLILSGTDLDQLALSDPEVKAAFDYIVAYYKGLNNGKDLQTAAGKIGNWIDANHCK